MVFVMANTAVRSAFTYGLNFVVQQTKIRVTSVNNYPKGTRDFSQTIKLVIDSERRSRETKIETRSGEAAAATKLTLEQRAEIARIAGRLKNQPN